MISASRLRKELRYDPLTGDLWWRVPKKGRRMWRPAGRISKQRHVTIGIEHRQYMAHVLIWTMQTGSWPTDEIDHKNRKRADNRWSNLRLATPSQNRANFPIRKDNTSGRKGVSWMANVKKWRARTYVDGKEKHLGLFDNRDEAYAVYAKAVRREHGAFAYVP